MPRVWPYSGLEVLPVPSSRTPISRYLDVARAAKLAGVPAREITRLISENRLPSFEGKISYHDLVIVYPEIGASRTKMVEITGQIKEDAIMKAVNERPGYKFRDLEGVLEQCRQLQEDLAYHQQQARKYKEILRELRPKLEQLQEISEHKNRIQSIINWFAHKTKGIR